MSPRKALLHLSLVSLSALVTASCSPKAGTDDADGPSADASVDGADGARLDAPVGIDTGACLPGCSNDGTAIEDCDGGRTACGDLEVCSEAKCVNACDAARTKRSSVGCEYYAVRMDAYADGCFVAFIANTSPGTTHIHADLGGSPIDLSRYAATTTGSGSNTTYVDFDEAKGLSAADVAMIFLDDGQFPPCPHAAFDIASFRGTGIGSTAVRITSDAPVVAYQMLPYGAAGAAITGSTLLLPTSAWDTNYLAVDAYGPSLIFDSVPSLSIVAAEDATKVTLLPGVDVLGGSAGPGAGVPATTKGQALTVELSAGQVLQISQTEELTGSPVQADKPVGLFGGHTCMNVPATASLCDHGEQQIPPVRALGSEYVGVPYRQRSSIAEQPRWRFMGAADGTTLTFSPDVGGPKTLSLGQVVEIATDTPFVVTSQDDKHPFFVNSYMTGSATVETGFGDPEVLRVTPAAQYLSRYVIFTDPTYPETNLVFVRRRTNAGFADVTLDCAGVLGGWQAIGNGDFEWTRFDLVLDGAPQVGGACDNGRHVLSSDVPFGLWIWGWGSPDAPTPNPDGGPPVVTHSCAVLGATCNVSYGYTGGEAVVPINDIVIPADPK